MGQIDGAPRGASNSAVSRKPTVLLVDEDPGNLNAYGVGLQELGYRVRGCKSYKEGADLLESQAFDLIIVSQGSPFFEGRLVLERALEVDRRLRVLVLARCLDMSCYLEAMQLGAVDYLVEPVTVSGIIQVLEHLPRAQGVVA